MPEQSTPDRCCAARLGLGGARSPQKLFRAEMALLQCGRWTVTYHRVGNRDDPLSSLDEGRVCNVGGVGRVE